MPRDQVAKPATCTVDAESGRKFYSQGSTQNFQLKWESARILRESLSTGTANEIIDTGRAQGLLILIADMSNCERHIFCPLQSLLPPPTRNTAHKWECFAQRMHTMGWIRPAAAIIMTTLGKRGRGGKSS